MVTTGSINGSGPIRQQTITSTNDDTIHLRMYAPQTFNEFW